MYIYVVQFQYILKLNSFSQNMASVSQQMTLVKGYMRQNYHSTKPFIMPDKIIETCLEFVTLLYQHVAFSTEYKSAKGLELTDNHRCVRKSAKYPRTTWVLGDIEPVYEGTYCWRVFVTFLCLYILYMILK